MVAPGDKPHGVIELRHCLTVKSAEDKTGKPHAFEIATPDKVFFLFADSDVEKDEWIGKIGKAKPAKPRGTSKAKAARIEKLKTALADLDERRQAEVADFEDQQTTLNKARQEAEVTYEADRKSLAADLKKAKV
jgi:hypothetical protein